MVIYPLVTYAQLDVEIEGVFIPILTALYIHIFLSEIYNSQGDDNDPANDVSTSSRRACRFKNPWQPTATSDF